MTTPTIGGTLMSSRKTAVYRAYDLRSWDRGSKLSGGSELCGALLSGAR